MKQLRFVVPVFMLVLSFALASVANAQPRPTPTNVPNGPTQTNASQDDDTEVNKGSIRGGVYSDTNNDGRCTGDEERIPGVPVSFYKGGVKAVTLTTGDDGTYGLVAAEFGEWDVVVEPPAGWRVLGSDTIHVNIIGSKPSKVWLVTLATIVFAVLVHILFTFLIRNTNRWKSHSVVIREIQNRMTSGTQL